MAKKRKIQKQTLDLLFKAWETQLEMGVDVITSTEKLLTRIKRRKGAHNKTVHDLRYLAGQLKTSGQQPAEVLRPFVSQIEYMILRAGDLSGQQHQSMKEILKLKEGKKGIIKTFKSAMATPLLFFLITIVLMYIMDHTIVPSLASTLPVNRWTGTAKLMAESTFLIHPVFFVPFLVLSTLLSIIVYRSFSTWGGVMRVQAERALPFIYGFYRDYQGTIWMQGLSALLRTGVPDVTAIEQQMAIASPWMQERLKTITSIMKNGYELADAITYAGPQRFSIERPMNGIKYDFPSPSIVDELGIYSGFSNFYEKLYILQSQWMIQLEDRAKIMANAVGMVFRMMLYGYFILITLGTNALSTQMSSLH